MRYSTIILAAFAALTVSACKSAESARVGFARTNASDDFDALEELDVDRLNGLEAQFTGSFEEESALEDVRGVAILSLGRADSEFFGNTIDVERKSFGLGIEPRHMLNEKVGVFAQVGGMVTQGEISVGGITDDDTAFGPFVGVGLEIHASEDVQFVLSYRPLEPTLEIDGVDVDTQTLMVGVGFSL